MYSIDIASIKEAHVSLKRKIIYHKKRVGEKIERIFNE
jgi:hypothetical protein